MRLLNGNFSEYAFPAAAKSVAGIGTPFMHMATTDAPASFLSSTFTHTQIMVGWMGASKDAPGTMCTGSSNPVQFTTHEFGTSGGDTHIMHMEAAMLATPLDLSYATSTPDLQIVDGRVLTTSLAIAAYFDKRHDDLLKRIRLLECTSDFTARNFAASEYVDSSGRSLPCYQITRDGFAFLAMGFTGKKAARFKEAYITAFNQMEERLRQPSAPTTRLLMSMEGEKVASVQVVPFDSFVISPDNFDTVFSSLIQQIPLAKLQHISNECISQLMIYAQRNLTQ